MGALCESVLSYLRELPSPIIPPCIYPQLQAAVALQQQQSTGQFEQQLFPTTTVWSAISPPATLSSLSSQKTCEINKFKMFCNCTELVKIQCDAEIRIKGSRIHRYIWLGDSKSNVIMIY